MLNPITQTCIVNPLLAGSRSQEYIATSLCVVHTRVEFTGGFIGCVILSTTLAARLEAATPVMWVPWTGLATKILTSQNSPSKGCPANIVPGSVPCCFCSLSPPSLHSLILSIRPMGSVLHLEKTKQSQAMASWKMCLNPKRRKNKCTYSQEHIFIVVCPSFHFKANI